jgi:Protein of unknown function (DUF2393)
MPETLHIESPGEAQPPRGRPWVAWMGAATILIALIFVMWPGSARRSSSIREARLPFGALEQAYAPNLHIANLELSRAENFLNQEVTTVAGDITNTGGRPVSNVEITLEFSDELGEIVLRESRTAFTPQAAPLAPGATRDFQISFEHIPSSWNIQKPAVRVSGVLFASGKE